MVVRGMQDLIECIDDSCSAKMRYQAGTRGYWTLFLGYEWAMRFVPVKNESQLDLQTIHRVRQRLVGRRTALINQLRAILRYDAGVGDPQRH